MAIRNVPQRSATFLSSPPKRFASLRQRKFIRHVKTLALYDRCGVADELGTIWIAAITIGHENTPIRQASRMDIYAKPKK